jgi:signal transduction histidine kinase
MRAEREREAQDRTSAQEALASAKWVLEAQNETLKDVDRAKDAFVANLAHELRTPLTSTRQSDRIVLDVADNGPGIKAADQARVFDRFYRTSSAAETPGTGLGLAIVKAIAEAHGGRVLLESRLGDGTTFRVEFPLIASATDSLVQ